jgi:Carboxypeptidase regulatory-like domain
MRNRLAALVALSLLSFASGAGAQSTAINATIEGVVKDTTGAVLSGATVTVTNVEVGAQRTLTTGSDGGFRAPLLPLGTYKVRVELPSFKTAERSGISLSAGQTALLNFALEVGGQTDTVSVTAELPVAQPGKIDLGRTISEAEIKNLPLVSRNPYNFAFLQANVTGYENQ